MKIIKKKVSRIAYKSQHALQSVIIYKNSQYKNLIQHLTHPCSQQLLTNSDTPICTKSFKNVILKPKSTVTARLALSIAKNTTLSPPQYIQTDILQILSKY